jgi:hypothetical protein
MKAISNNGRTVHAIQIKLHCVADRSVIVWPAESSKLCVQLLNGRRTWITARTGDAVWLSQDGTKKREHVESVELYRVFPAEENGRVVKSAWHWLNPEGSQMNPFDGQSDEDARRSKHLGSIVANRSICQAGKPGVEMGKKPP